MGTFFSYAVISIFAFIFIYKMVPETKGKSLEEIRVLLEEKRIY